jgi:polysaccharide export outer membrane protein
VGFRDSSSDSNCSHPVNAQIKTAKRVQIAGRERTGVVGSRTVSRAGCCRFPIAPLFLSFLLAGCGDCKFLAQTCPSPPDPQSAAETPVPNAAYRIGCPDVLELSFLDHPQWDVLVSVGLDGRLPLEYPGSPQVEGRTLDDVRFELARMADVAPERISVSLAAARSSHIYIHGPIRGRMRIVPYQGPERVIDMLKRVGGLPPGSKMNQVYVVRPNVAVGLRPEVFRVKVVRVLLGGDQTTNVILKPSDQVYIGESMESELSRLLPDWLAPMYRQFVGLLPDEWLQQRVNSP